MILRFSATGRTSSTGSGRFTSALVASARRHGFGRVGVLGVEQLADLLGTNSGPRSGCGYVLRLSDETVCSVDGYTLVALAARAETCARVAVRSTMRASTSSHCSETWR